MARVATIVMTLLALVSVPLLFLVGMELLIAVLGGGLLYLHLARELRGTLQAERRVVHS